jgi:predicted nuclease with TOPRIM domain
MTHTIQVTEETLREKLVRALSAQKGLYLQLLALAREQSGHVATGQSEALMAVLAARSRLIEEVAPLDQKLQPFKGRWQEVLDGLPGGDRAAVAGLLKEVQQLLADILAHDEQDKESLMRQKADIGVQIKRTVTGAALNRAYGRK